MDPTNIALSIKDLTVAFGKKPVLWDIDLDIPKGALTAIVGPNGAGKSTLLKSALGILKPTAGRVDVFGQPLTRQRSQIAYIPQRNSVDWDFPTNVLDVVLMGTYSDLGWFKRPGKKEQARAMEALKKVSMQDFSNRQISQLSGGQQQRVFLARALVQNAAIYIMDEPFVGVDAVTEKAIISLLKELRDQQKTVIVVHHDLQTIEDYFDWICLLNVRQIAFGKIQDTFTDENLRLTYSGHHSFIPQSHR
ncbi:MAG: metal ABC transporter ATP-binding protein [Candidatus Margulisiibacteriota bacterium]